MVLRQSNLYNAIIVRDYLNGIFKNGWLGTYGVATVTEFFLWGYLKIIIFAEFPISLPNLKEKNKSSMLQSTESQITAAINNEFMRRVCFNHNGV